MALLTGKLVILGVSGGIAAYRTCELARLLVKDGATVQAVLTESASSMVGPLSFQALTGHPAEVGAGGLLTSSGMPHIDMSQAADLIMIAPATANTLAKLACGLADNLLTTVTLTAVGRGCPLVLAPAMNTNMWSHPITQDNLDRLRKLKQVTVLGPTSGSLACRQTGPGRMEEPEILLQAARYALARKDLIDRRIVVTAGPTREPIDPVRFLTNRSSGKMGYALAEMARYRGARVVLITGPTGLTPPWGMQVVQVVTADEMGAVVDSNIQGSDALLMAAAVADFKPKDTKTTKIKKAAGPTALQLEPTRDILASIGSQLKPEGRCLLVGFAAETGDPTEAARKKLRAKNLDLVVANDVSLSGAGFDVDTNQVVLVDQNGTQSIPMLSKMEVADLVLDRVATMLDKGK